VASARHLSVMHEVEVAFEKTPGRQRKRHLFWKCGEARWHRDPASRRGRLVRAAPVYPNRGARGAGDQIPHDVCEQLIFSESVFDPGFGIAPDLEPFHDPRGSAQQAVRKRERDRLRLAGLFAEVVKLGQPLPSAPRRAEGAPDLCPRGTARPDTAKEEIPRPSAFRIKLPGNR
jgi:hypothetical protein